MPLRIDVLKLKGPPANIRSSITIDQDGGSIGRAMDNSIVLNDESVSRRHATISFEEGHYYLTDQSSNGTLIYSRDLLVEDETVELLDGDILRIGDHELRVVITAESPAPEKHSSTIPFRRRSVTEPPPRDEVDDYSYAEARSIGQAKAPPVVIKEFSIDDFFEDEDEKEDVGKSLKPETNREVSPPAVVPDLRRQGAASSVKSNVAEEIPDDLDKVFEDLDDFPAVAPASPAVEKASDGHPVVHETLDRQQRPEENPSPKPVATDPKITELIQPPPEDIYREIFDRFLKGAGLPKLSFTDSEIPDLVEKLGVVFRELVNGLWTVLRGRAEMKAQIRIEMTMVRPNSNNPLKFSPTLEDALKHLLKRDHPSFLEPLDAVRESFGDIMNHQLALNAGIQAALVDALDQFDPERFSGNKDSSILHTKSKFWKAYCDAYPELKEEALEGILGKAFVKAYEEQLEKLRNANSDRT